MLKVAQWIFLLTLLLKTGLFCAQIEGKILICGVCRNTEYAVANTIRNIEELGSRFEDYAVIIYENNSQDKTAKLMAQWAETSPRVTFVTEDLPPSELPPSRILGISRARNIVLDLARNQDYDDFTFLIMADLDFIHPWPVDAIAATTQIPGDWDCISANGTYHGGTLYWDRYAFRDRTFPFGPEILGSHWWKQLKKTAFSLKPGHLKQVYSAFGGLAVYKRSSILPFSYSGTATEDLEHYYKLILSDLPPANPHLQQYLQMHQLRYNKQLYAQPILFFKSKDYWTLETCEHLTLHASMAMHGFGTFFINPEMEMRYAH